ncbi:uncharacterized protein LOC112877206 [Panicum hallii]|uniref:uncharacterized protein LOC112877206 n=1 Tax=Panicum hallii TaxID=206008 RepID=UPI000DF4EFCD|nr:uncharacterized protein LOC112877206 [Panicum hallii]
MLASSTSSTEQAHPRQSALRRGTRIVARRGRRRPGMYMHGRAPLKGSTNASHCVGEWRGSRRERTTTSSVPAPAARPARGTRAGQGHVTPTLAPSTCSMDCLAAPAWPPRRSPSSSALRRRARGQGPGSWHDDSKRPLPVARRPDPTRLSRRRSKLNWLPRGTPRRSSDLGSYIGSFTVNFILPVDICCCTALEFLRGNDFLFCRL